MDTTIITGGRPRSGLTLAQGLAGIASLLLVGLLIMTSSRAAFTGEVAADATWETAEVQLSHDAEQGVDFATPENLVPGDVVTGEVTVTYDGSAESVDIALLADVTNDPAGLAEVLNLTIDDGVDTAYSGTLAHLSNSDGELPWRSAAPGDSRHYAITVELDAAANDDHADAAASASFVWHAVTNPTRGQGE